MNITFLIITRKRTGLLKRAIASIKGQNFGGNIKILILIDDCIETFNFLEKEYSYDVNISWHLNDRKISEKSGPARAAYLRNIAVKEAESEWVSFLDDDNELEPFHVSELCRCAMLNNAEAVYCYRQLFYTDGTPYCFIDGMYPWARSKMQAKEQFERLSSKGIIEKGSNIIRDQIDDSSGGINLVDTNVWLIKREILLKITIPVDYSYQDWLNIICEDDKMLQSLIDSNVKIFCNRVPSVKYYLGGYSNKEYINNTINQIIYSEEWIETKI